MQADKAVDFFGCLPGHVIEVADAEQAYIQAEMKGDPTKALYGHPDAGTYWEQKCDAHVKAVGFVPIGLEWP